MINSVKVTQIALLELNFIKLPDHFLLLNELLVVFFIYIWSLNDYNENKLPGQRTKKKNIHTVYMYDKSNREMIIINAKKSSTHKNEYFLSSFFIFETFAVSSSS